MALLDSIDSPQDLKRLSPEELPALAKEIRDRIIEVVSRNGGHLSSNLGVVELTIALHYIFDAPRDKIIWDVGHQSYTHKLLTGRKDRFHTLRESGGISGFPKMDESPYDSFGTGHSSTSISAALGMIEARDRKGEDFKVIAVIGDGAMNSGLAFEGLNQAGHLKKDLIVILNDNEFSISPNVGALSSYLSRLMTGEFYTRIRKETESILKNIPKLGESMLKVAKKAEESFKGLIVPGMLFEELGFEYVGPIDGHRFDVLIETLTNVKRLNWPTLIHVVTKKGKGYGPAEGNPSAFHGTPPFDIDSGKVKKDSSLTYSDVFGSTMIKLAKEDKRLLAISAAMPEGTGLDRFAKEYPDRFYDVGISESHGVTFAAGLATQGFHPVVAIYSTFLQRAYDQILHDVCIQNLPVTFALDRAGIVGDDGPTHNGTFDFAYLRHIPNMVVMAPKDENELQHMIKTAAKYQGPSAIRYPRGKGIGVPLDDRLKKLEIGIAEYIMEGEDVTVVAIGVMVNPVLEAAQKLKNEGISVGVVNARFAKPLDRELIGNLAKKVKRIVTVEEHVLDGGFGSAVLEFLSTLNITGLKVIRIGLPDSFIEQGSQMALRKRYGLDSDGIERAVRSIKIYYEQTTERRHKSGES
jgi:1-deoxy-D-xylulose-5-phosphate synthase